MRSMRGGFISRSRGPLQKVCHDLARMSLQQPLSAVSSEQNLTKICFCFDWFVLTLSKVDLWAELSYWVDQVQFFLTRINKNWSSFSFWQRFDQQIVTSILFFWTWNWTGWWSFYHHMSVTDAMFRKRLSEANDTHGPVTRESRVSLCTYVHTHTYRCHSWADSSLWGLMYVQLANIRIL